MTRMKAERLEQAQSGMRLENRAQAKEHSAPTPVTSDLMTVKEAAAYLRVSAWAIYDLTRQRGRVRMQLPIPCIRLGKSLKFRRSSLDRWLEQLEKMAG
jgi:excisionase family DNA binding protein